MTNNNFCFIVKIIRVAQLECLYTVKQYQEQDFTKQKRQFLLKILGPKKISAEFTYQLKKIRNSTKIQGKKKKN